MISVVIPTLNEEQALSRQAASLRGAQIIVSDGGSTDQTIEGAQTFADVTVRAPRGRSRQMNAGARHATEEVLVFLHADTRLPPGALAALQHTLRNPRVVGGCFRKRIFERPLLLRLWDMAANLRLDLHLTLYGDRTIFVRRDAFEALGGFDERLDLFEDVDLGRRLRRLGRIVQVPVEVETSARRYEQGGVLRTILLMTALELGYRLGWDLTGLIRRYRAFR